MNNSHTENTLSYWVPSSRVNIVHRLSVQYLGTVSCLGKTYYDTNHTYILAMQYILNTILV